MGARFDRLRCEVFQNLFLSPMNTGFVRPAVATVLTVYGIETESKRANIRRFELVATVLTVYGIETTIEIIALVKRIDYGCNSTYRLRY